MKDQEFFAEAQEPDFPDKMAFQITREPQPGETPDTTFSQEALEEMLSNIERFVVARIIGRQKTGMGPKEINVVVDIDWASDPQVPADMVLNPWWSIEGENGKGMTIPDGERRGRAIGKRKR